MTTASPANPTAATLAAFVNAIRWSALPGVVRERTQELVLDHVGVALRGSVEASTAPLMGFVRATQGTGGASVIGGGFSTAAAWAALVNGTAAHSIEMDDVTRESSLHPGVAVIPAALAMAEERGAEATDFLEAIVAGYEVAIRVGNALNPASAYRRGFHPTGVAGVFGATVAAGRLLRLDEERLTRALGVAGTMASGSLEYLADGSWTKRLNPGWAAHGGIVAASLAAGGYTGPVSVFEGRLGLLKGYTDEPAPGRLLAELGRPYQVMRVSLKPYACCRYSHGLIDCMLRLRQEHGLRPDDVATIRLGVLSAGALLVAVPIEQKRAPRSVVEAQFSAPFAGAIALVSGAAGVREYSEGHLVDPVVRALMARTECFTDPSLDAVYPDRWPAVVEVALRGGRKVSQAIEFPTGDPENPVSRSDLVTKFRDLAGQVLPDESAHALARRLLDLDEGSEWRETIGWLRNG